MTRIEIFSHLFKHVTDGDLTPARGAVIGAGVPEADQQALYDLAKQWEKKGSFKDSRLAELIRMNQRAPVVTETPEEPAQGGIFGRTPEEVTHSLLREKAEVSDYIRQRLAKEKKLFGPVSTQAAADTLGQAGNVIKTGENAAQAASESRSGTVR